MITSAVSVRGWPDQPLVGGATAHYRADPGSFYGFQLENTFPSNLMRTWHLQSAIMWIATSYVAAALFLSRSLRADEPRGLAAWAHFLFVAFIAVIGGSLLGEWAGISDLLGNWWFWLGNPGWEYLELGRIWQYLLVIGLAVWFAVLYWVARPSKVTNADARPIVRMFLLAAPAIPMFYIPALFFNAHTNLTVVETWRFWIIHLWVKGFFEFFATTVVALAFYQLGIAHRNTALRVIYLDAILYFLGGLIGTGHAADAGRMGLHQRDQGRGRRGRHATLMGVFGMLAIALMVFVLRQTADDRTWPGIEKYVKVAFWGTNIGVAMMIVMSQFPSGVLQMWDVIEHGYWHARSIEYMSTTRSHAIEWLGVRASARQHG